MNRYLIVGHFLHGTYTLQYIEKKQLIDRAQGNCDHIFDLELGAEFDPKQNAWVTIEKKEVAP